MVWLWNIACSAKAGVAESVFVRVNAIMAVIKLTNCGFLWQPYKLLYGHS